MKTFAFFSNKIQTALFLPILILLALVLTTSCASNKLNLVSNSSSEYEIVVPEDAQELVFKAAEELQKYIYKISGADINIISLDELIPGKNKIYIGVSVPNQEDSDMTEHQVILSNNNKDLYITGGSSQSTLNAVYVFLEEYLGCRWYSPTAEMVPETSSIILDLPINYNYTPEITTRTVHSRLFYNHPEFANKHKVSHEAFPNYVPTARVHTFHRFMPEEHFYKQHPEYYALRGDRRLPTQLCLTNPDVLRIVIDSVQVYFGRFPEAKVISVSQDDNTQYCECEECSKVDEEEGSPSGTMIQFVNLVAAEFPEKTISTLAYQYTRKPSKTRPAPNVLVTLCSIECDRSAPIAENCTDFANDMIGWKQKTPNIRIWDYTTQFTNFLAPFPNIHTLQPNIQFFRDNNAKWVFEQHSHHPSELFELRSYLTAKLLWNPDLDTDEIITDFTNGYYEEAGPFIKNYIDLVHMEIQNDDEYFLFLYGDPSQAFSSFLRPPLLEKYDEFFNHAEDAVRDKPEVLERVETARLSIDYAILEASRKGISAKYNLVESKMEVEKRLSNFSQTCNQADITLMNEMGFTVEEYFSFYNKTLDRVGEPNIAAGKKVTLNTNPKKYADEDPQALTDGAWGGNSFYSNWLGFEGNDMEAVIDLGEVQEITSLSTAFLQVTNHIVFFPEKLSVFISTDNKSFKKVGEIKNPKPLTSQSKTNDIEYFNFGFPKVKARYIKIYANSLQAAPVWHNAAGLPCWIFCDEVIVN